MQQCLKNNFAVYPYGGLTMPIIPHRLVILENPSCNLEVFPTISLHYLPRQPPVRHFVECCVCNSLTTFITCWTRNVQLFTLREMSLEPVLSLLWVTLRLHTSHIPSPLLREGEQHPRFSVCKDSPKLTRTPYLQSARRALSTELSRAWARVCCFSSSPSIYPSLHNITSFGIGVEASLVQEAVTCLLRLSSTTR